MFLLVLRLPARHLAPPGGDDRRRATCMCRRPVFGPSGRLAGSGAGDTGPWPNPGGSVTRHQSGPTDPSSEPGDRVEVHRAGRFGASQAESQPFAGGGAETSTHHQVVAHPDLGPNRSHGRGVPLPRGGFDAHVADSAHLAGERHHARNRSHHGFTRGTREVDRDVARTPRTRRLFERFDHRSGNRTREAWRRRVRRWMGDHDEGDRHEQSRESSRSHQRLLARSDGFRRRRPRRDGRAAG